MPFLLGSSIIPDANATTEGLMTTAQVASLTSAAGSSGTALQPTAVVVSTALVGATIALTAAQSGAYIINASTSGSPSFTLPAVAAGLNYHYVCSSISEGCTFTCTGATPVIYGRTGGTSTTTGPGAGQNSTASTGSIVHTQGTAVLGDNVDFVSDGTNWFMVNQIGIFGKT